MTRNKTTLVNKICRYLKSLGITTMKFNEGLLIVGLVSRKGYHYVSIELDTINPQFYISRRPFTFKRIKATNFDTFLKEINLHLNEEQLHNTRQK